MDILEESQIQENRSISTKPRRHFTPEQKAEAVKIVTQWGKPISQIAKKMGLTESALRKWIKQAQIDQAAAPNGALTTQERQELAQLRREVKRLQMERDFLTAVASSGGTPPTLCLKKVSAFFARASLYAAESNPMG